MKSALRALLLAMVLTLGSPWAMAAEIGRTFAIDHMLGKDDAPIIVIEYASTTCSHCGDFHKNTFPKFKENWIDTGNVLFIYRDFPTSPTQVSIGASLLPHCSDDERYFTILGLIADNQDRWMQAGSPLDNLKKLLRIAGMSSADVDTCLGRQDLANAIIERAKDGNTQFKIKTTPSFVINGKVHEGNIPYEEFAKILQNALPK